MSPSDFSALDDPQLKFASDCIKRVLDSEVSSVFCQDTSSSSDPAAQVLRFRPRLPTNFCPTFQVIAEWNSRLGAFGQLTEMEVVRMICRENADMGGVIVSKRLYENPLS